MALIIEVPNAFAVATCNTVGARLGARDVAGARSLAATAVACGLVAVAAYTIPIYVGGDTVARWFTTDVAVLASAKTAWGALCIFLAVDSVSVMLLGVNRAIGVQSRSALCVLVILWLMGLPIVFLLTSNHTLPTVPELSQAYWILDSLYAAFCVSLLSVACFADWSELASLAAAPGSQVEAGKPAEREALLPSEPPVETSRKEA